MLSQFGTKISSLASCFQETRLCGLFTVSLTPPAQSKHEAIVFDTYTQNLRAQTMSRHEADIATSHGRANAFLRLTLRTAADTAVTASDNLNNAGLGDELRLPGKLRQLATKPCGSRLLNLTAGLANEKNHRLASMMPMATDHKSIL